MFLSKNKAYFNEVPLSPELFLRLSAGNPVEQHEAESLGAHWTTPRVRVHCRGIPQKGWEKPASKDSQNTLLTKSLLAHD